LNPKLGLIRLFPVLNRHIGSYFGLDRYNLPLLGSPPTWRFAVKYMLETTTGPFVNFCKLWNISEQDPEGTENGVTI